MAGQHHQHYGYELGQISRDGMGQRGDVLGPWDLKDSDKTG